MSPKDHGGEAVVQHFLSSYSSISAREKGAGAGRPCFHYERHERVTEDLLSLVSAKHLNPRYDLQTSPVGSLVALEADYEML